MSEAKISEAAVEAALKRYLELEPGEAETNPMDDSTKAFMRELLAAALPHLHPQPASRQISEGDRRVLEKLMEALPTIGLNGWAVGVEVLGRVLDDSLDAPQTAELAEPSWNSGELTEQQGVDYAELVLSRYVKICIEEIPDDCYPPELSRELRVDAMRRALAATGKQVDPAWPLHDRVEFALRDAGFDLDEASRIALQVDGKQQVGEVQGDGLDVEWLKARVSSIHSTVSLGHQTGPHAYAGEDFGRYLAEAAGDCQEIMRALAARQPGAQVPYGSEFAVSRTMEDAEAASDGMLPAALVPVADEWYRLCERRFSVDRIRISGKLAEAIVEAVCAAPPAQGIDLGQFRGWLCTTTDGVVTDWTMEEDSRTRFERMGRIIEPVFAAGPAHKRDAAPGVG